MSPKLLATFLEYAARQVVTTGEWHRFIVNHYQDEAMEHARSECARIFFEHCSNDPLPSAAQNYLKELARYLRESSNYSIPSGH